MHNPETTHLEKRVDFLEETNLFKMMALDLAKELGEFHSSINKLETPDIIFEKCASRIRQIMGFRQIAFLLVDENNSDFHLSCCYPEADKDALEKEIDILVEDGTFSRAILEKKPVTAYSEDFCRQLLLHVLSTVSRVRGMMVGVLEKNSKYIPEASFELLTILMAHCANTLESFELYSQLRASEKQYRLLAETAEEVILLVSDNGKILFANEAALKAGGYSRQALTGLDITALIEDYPDVMTDSREGYSGFYAAVLKSRSGKKVPLEIAIKPVSNGDSSAGNLIVGRDISERVRAETEKKNLEEKLWQAQKMEAIGLLAGGIAHDFNNILSIIVNYTALSLAGTPKENPVHRHLEKVQTASKRAVILARKLHTIGRKDEHQTKLIDIVMVIHETIDLLSSSLGKNIMVKPEIANEVLTVVAEETRIQQILMNLITNAAYAMKHTGGVITVSACKAKAQDEKLFISQGLLPGKFLRLSVMDNGPGIESGDLPRVFDPYFSTKNGGDNSGLGLAVVHGIVKHYKGAVEVQTQLGMGTTFHIYLPEADPLSFPG
ncbi:MAG: ATP-binding protein [Desulfobacula sp.]|jgi:PAS domain S-box-containing protein